MHCHSNDYRGGIFKNYHKNFRLHIRHEKQISNFLWHFLRKKVVPMLPLSMCCTASSKNSKKEIPSSTFSGSSCKEVSSWRVLLVRSPFSATFNKLCVLDTWHVDRLVRDWLSTFLGAKSTIHVIMGTWPSPSAFVGGSIVVSIFPVRPSGLLRWQ